MSLSPRSHHEEVGVSKTRTHDEGLTVNGDGTDALDFTYIQDLVQGVMRTMVTPAARNEIRSKTLNKLLETKVR